MWMNLEAIFQRVFDLAGTFSPTLVIFLFFICLIGELGVSAPYLLETVWLVSGYNCSHGVLPLVDLLLLWLAAQSGRQCGSTILYYLGRFGSMPLGKLYRKHFRASLSGKLSQNNAVQLGFFSRLNSSLPFSVALGRLLGLRLPITLALGAQRQFRTLLSGIVLSSLIWDGVYLSLGAVLGASVALKPFQMILYCLLGLTILYAVCFTIRRFQSRERVKSDVSKKV